MLAFATVVVFQLVHILIWKSFNLFYLRDSLTVVAQFVGDRAVPGSKPGVHKTYKLFWCEDTFRAPLRRPVRYNTPEWLHRALDKLVTLSGCLRPYEAGIGWKNLEKFPLTVDQNCCTCGAYVGHSPYTANIGLYVWSRVTMDASSACCITLKIWNMD